ncbi:hypothetical protein ZIOFF_001508 [Zingiber officinale]|uniref:Uncharacterized protein n=2 Tax=Zingiber officinale TaxID=94328 RepID=A0A8J5HVJ0_ZINOF|nr:hypothetical protein ZIOFF_001508 [Zingiber officinale]
MSVTVELTVRHDHALQMDTEAATEIKPKNEFPSKQLDSRSPSWLTRLFNLLPLFTFIFLTVNAVESAYHSRHDPSALVFSAFIYSDLLLLFACLKMFDNLGPDSPPKRKGQLKLAVWVLAAGLNVAFAWRVAAVMPLPLSVMLWLMSGVVTVGGFFGLFIYREDGPVPAYAHVKSTQLTPAENA